MASLKDKTHDERHEAMKAKRAELQTWATDNNIPAQYLRFAFGHGGKGHGMGPRELGDKNSEVMPPAAL
jgi:hypothetical protein